MDLPPEKRSSLPVVGGASSEPSTTSGTCTCTYACVACARAGLLALGWRRQICRSASEKEERPRGLRDEVGLGKVLELHVIEWEGLIRLDDLSFNSPPSAFMKTPRLRLPCQRIFSFLFNLCAQQSQEVNQERVSAILCLSICSALRFT